MKISKRFFGVATCFLLLLLAPVKNDSFAACPASPEGDLVKIAGYAYTAPTIQVAYDHASKPVIDGGMGLPEFTLQLVGGIFTEDVVIDGGAVEFDGGYDCSFATKVSSSSIFGTITIKSSGSLVSTTNTESPKVVSTDQCAFDIDGDGFTSIGSCSGSADDCNDNDFATNPGASEICDGLDNNCDGQVDEGLTGTDADGDGYYAVDSCGPVTDDCNDNNAGINPGALDIPYDGINQDCSLDGDLTFANGNACADCHVPDNSLALLHTRALAPDTSCTFCHTATVSNFLSGHYGDTVRTAGNNMTVGSIINCFSCHDSGSHDGGPLGNGSSFVWGNVYLAWANNNLSCDTCHANRALVHVTGTAHNNRIIDSSCANCHTSDTTVLGNPGSGTLTSAADVDALHGVQQVTDCALCHAYSGTLLNKANVLSTIQQGLNGTQVSCLNCHTDKGANHGNFEHPVSVGPNDLSYDAPGQPCSDCHVVANWTEIEGTEHNVDTNGVGSCATCHNSPRQAVIDAIALGADPTHCLDCHSDKDLTVHGSVDHVSTTYVTGGTTFCLDCHDPGGSANATVDVTHGGDCTLCHTTVPALQPGVPVDGGDCVTCHTVTWQVLHMNNPPDHSALVTTSGTNNCASCHADALVDASTHLADCSNCHDASDGSLLSSAVGKDFTIGGNCETCHTDSWEATHNTTNTPDHSILVRVDATSCGDCHSDPPPLTDNGDPKVHNTCGSCHNTDGSTRSLAIGQSLITGGDCLSCHADTFDTTHSGHVHTVAEGSGDLSFDAPGTPCSDCHVVSTWTEIEGIEHNVATNGAGSCSTCHNSPRQEVIDAIALGADPTNCLDCHSNKNLAVHGSIDHVASTDVTLATACDGCHDPGGAANATVDVTHSANCTLCHTTVPALQPGVPAGPADCATCHSAAWNVTHLSVTPDHSSLVTTTGTDNCASCHADVLIDATTHLSNCSNCHNGDGSLVTMYGTNNQNFLDGGNCQTCHTLGWESTHFDNNNGTTTHNALVQVGTTSCGSCHSDPPLLTDNADAKVHSACSNCHNANGSLIVPIVGLNFITGGDCTTCHGSNWGTLHGTAPDHGSLVTTTGTDNCASCHADALIDISTHQTDCSDCHSTADGSLLSSAAGKDFITGGNCETCHTSGWGTTHTTNTPDHTSLVQVAATDCSSCHDNTLVSAAAETHLENCSNCHSTNGGLVGTAVGKDFTTGGDCTTCHGSNWGTLHGTAPDHSSLVTTTGTDNCASCHADALIDISTHQTDCSDCHSTADGSLLSSAAGKDFTTGGNCETCHTSGWGTTHTTNTPDHTSLVQVAATDCSSCHDNTLVSAAAETHLENCSNCHSTNGTLQSSAVGKDFTAGGDCTTCHGTDWGGLHTTAPDHTGIVTVASTSCASCHDDTLISASAKTHDACTSCHAAVTGDLVSLAIGQSAPGDCTDCHTGSWNATHNGHSHTVELGAGDLSSGASCGVCHVVATWGQINGTEHNVATNGPSSCATCHNSPRQEVIDAIALGSNPTNCLDCHAGNAASHGSVDHVATGYVTLASPCNDCHNPGSAENATVDVTHGGDCSLCHTTVPALQPGVPADGGTCATCHTGDVQTAHPDCTACHGEPPSGSTAPNRDRAHSEHDVLGYGSVTPSCNACHNSATHYNGSTQVSIPSSFDDKDFGSPSFNGSTCSNTRCHGGRTTPSWSTGSLNVNTQCSSCHNNRDRGSNQYNDYGQTDDLHDKHVRGEGFACTECHSVTKLANGSNGNTHFSNLQTTTFELSPGLTVGGSDTAVGNTWNNSSNTCSNLSCHGENHGSGDEWFKY